MLDPAGVQGGQDWRSKKAGLKREGRQVRQTEQAAKARQTRHCRAGWQADGYSTHANKAGMLAEKTDVQARKVSKAGTQGKQKVTLGQAGRTCGTISKARQTQLAVRARQPGKQRRRGRTADQQLGGSASKAGCTDGQKRVEAQGK